MKQLQSTSTNLSRSLHNETTLMEASPNAKAKASQRNGSSAQDRLLPNDSLAPCSDEMARRAEIAAARVELLNLSTRGIEKITGLGRNQVADTLKGIPANPQYLLYVEEAIRIQVGRVLAMAAQIMSEGKRVA
jgi:hypothetical protein